MKKSLLVFMATLIITFAFSTSCFAKVSPSGGVLPTEEATTDDGSNVPNEPEDSNEPNSSETSPKTGVASADTGIQFAVPFVALITAAGVMLVAKKEYEKAE